MTPFDTFHSACPHDCPSTCALEVERISPTQIGRIHGARANTYTAGVICAKVARYAERQHHPDRLSQPLRRVGGKGIGQAAFQPMSWADALDEIAERFQRAEQSFGAEAVFPYYYAGTMGLVQRDGICRLTNEKKYSRMKSTICVALSDAGWQAGVGVMRGVDSREMAESDLIVVWGGNPVATQVNVMTHISRARKARNAKLVVVDPYRTGTAEAADLHLMLKPGSDAALAVAVMHVLFAEGLADRAYLAAHTDVPEELERHVAARPPEWAEPITGIPAATIRAFARLYGSTSRSFIRIGYGFSRSRNGAVNLHAVSCLPGVTGAWAHKGGGAHYSNRTIYHLDNGLIQGLEMLDSSVRELDQSRIGAILTGDRRDLGDGPPVTAMLIQNTNPMNVCPNSNLVRKGFEREDLFVAVHEQFMTETAAMADIVLPATTFLEHDDIYRASGHTHLQVTRRIVEPLGEARPNHFVVSELARRLGCRHRAFDLSEWEIIDETLRLSGHVDAQTMYDAHWQDCALDFETSHFLNGFGHAGGKFRFKPDWRAIGPDVEGLPTLPDYVALVDQPTPEHPLRLVTAPARQFLNSTFTMTPTSRRQEARPTVLIHPGDARHYGIPDGAEVDIGNRLGVIQIHAEYFDGILPGTLVIESLWGNADFRGGLGVNVLVSDDPGKPNGGAVFHDTAVWIRPYTDRAAL